ncbi:MAG: cation:proton antiporter [Candidatus Methanomethylicota archaeon]|uniref:Cation:proton antiporter n=1 Tax=Thermoproteota archaeon TaxID=2056631 RepID=A0A497F359_9CREN|nr:MAG: cation:proton antiporter [Candidatus Verstraetearchaeota archaeon]
MYSEVIFWPLISMLVFTGLTPFVVYLGERRGNKGVGGYWSAASFAVALYLLYQVYLQVASSPKGYLEYYIYAPPVGVMFYVDLISIFFSAVFIFLGFVSAIHSTRYMERDTGLGAYYALLQLMTLGMVYVTFTGDLFNLFVFWEVMAISSYVLVAFRKELWEPVEAGLKYLVMSGAGSATMLFAMSLIYGLTGSLNFVYVSEAFRSMQPTPLHYLAIAMLVVAFGIKAAAFPFWTWLPDAHPAAPSPISAMLSGVVIKTGVYGILRVIFLLFPLAMFHYGAMLFVMAALTMTIGNIGALLQRDIKRLLAFSSVAQIGYILVGLAAAGYGCLVDGLASAMFHVFNHAIMKGLAFLAAGALIYRLETRSLDDLAGVGRKMPISTVSLTIALFALGGVPPLNGFMSKWYLFMSAIDGGLWLLAVIGVINSAFSVAYYLWVFQRLFLAPPSKLVEEHAREAPAPILIALLMLVIIVFAVGVYPQPIISFARTAVQTFLVNFQITYLA